MTAMALRRTLPPGARTATAALLGLLLPALPAPRPAAAQEPEPPAEAEVVVLTDDEIQTLAVPRPDLSAMEPAARRRIETQQQVLARLLVAAEPARRELGQGFGFLGQMYQALELPGAAAEAYAAARRLVPEDPRWTYYAALAAHGQGDLEPAVELYRAHLAASPSYAAAHLRLGDALLDLGRPEEARAAYARALELEPESAAALYGLGRAAAASGDDRQAVERFLAVLDLAPAANAVAYQLGQAYRRLGDEERAAGFLALAGERQVPFADPLAGTLSSIEKAVALEVVRDLAAAGEGFVECDFGGFVRANLAGVPGAGAALRKAAEDAAEAPAATRARLRYAAGLLLAGEGDAEAAAAELEAAVGLDGSLADARLQLGNALAQLGLFDQALARYDQVLARDPGHVRALVQRGAVRANLGQLAEARADLIRAVELTPDSTEALLRLGAVIAREGDAESAAATFAVAVEAGRGTPAEADAWVALAGLARGRGETADAVAAYQKAMAADPEHGQALAALAGLLGETGRYPQSAAVYNRLVALEPDNRGARMGEITALILAGQDAAARARLEAALARDPGDVDVQDVLARHLAAAADRSVRDGARAVELARRLYDRFPTLESMETLAMAYAEAGRYVEAVDWQEKLLERVERESGSNSREADRVRANLARYEQGRSCCAG